MDLLEEKIHDVSIFYILFKTYLLYSFCFIIDITITRIYFNMRVLHETIHTELFF